MRAATLGFGRVIVFRLGVVTSLASATFFAPVGGNPSVGWCFAGTCEYQPMVNPIARDGKVELSLIIIQLNLQSHRDEGFSL